MNKHRIAILMATYNGDKYLRQQIESIINQTYRDFILYIRDDGSCDKTVEIVHDYARRDRRIHLISDTINHRGCGDSFKFLASNVDADYYLFSDQDDLWNNNKVELTLQTLIEHEKIGTPIVVHTDLEIVDENLNTLQPSFFKYTHREPEKASDLKYTCAYPTITGCTAAFNRKARDLYIKTPKTWCLHDQLLGLVVVANGGEIVPIYEQTLKYRQHSSNVLGATAERSVLSKFKRIKDSWNENLKWYGDVKAVTGMSPVRFIFNKVKAAMQRI